MTIRRLRLRVGNNLKRARLRVDLSQADVADLGVLTERHYQEIETGKVSPRLDTLHVLARLFNTSASAVLDDEPEPSGLAGRTPNRRSPQKKTDPDVLRAAGQRVAALLRERRRFRKTTTKPKRRK